MYTTNYKQSIIKKIFLQLYLIYRHKKQSLNLAKIQYLKNNIVWISDVIGQSMWSDTIIYKHKLI